MSPEDVARQQAKEIRKHIALPNGVDNCAFIKIPRTGTQSINSILKQSMGHRTAWEWRHKWPYRWPEIFKFTVVRHPYTRFVSAYHHVSEKKELNQFIAEGIDGDDYEIIFKPQHVFVYDGDELLVDKVYKYEDGLDNVWKSISRRIDVQAELPHLHKTPGTKQVLNDKSKKILADYYHEDFERFNYVK